MKCTLLAASTLAALAGAAHAQTELYISEYQFQASRMTAMSLDGTNPHTLFTLPAADWLPLGITYSPATQRLVWMDSAGGSELHSATTSGGSPTLIAGVPGFARGASLDAGGRIFFSTDNTVQRVNADGSGLTTIFTSASPNPVGTVKVDATNAHVYIGAEGDIKRMDLDGGSIKTIVRGIAQPRAIGLDISRGYIYWLDADTTSDYLGRARLDDTDFRVLHDLSPSIVQSPGLIDLLVDPVSGNVFVLDELTTQITRVGLNGETPTVIYTSPAGLAPSGVTLSTGEPAQALRDCNNNGIQDDVDIAAGAPDCDNNGVIDTCQASACPAHIFLIDQGSNAALTSGRALGIPSEWQIFQPFDVPAGGWTIAQIGLDGYNTNYADGSGLTLKLFPDNPATSLPDESVTLATTTVQLRFALDSVNWVYAPFNATIPEGRYWVRIEANNPTVYGGSINHGFSGLQSRSRGSSGNFTNPASPIALRLIQGSACYANCDNSTTSPILNVADFTCFLQRFAAGDSYANCDASTTPPVLNVADFTCFLQSFAAGCP